MAGNSKTGIKILPNVRSKRRKGCVCSAHVNGLVFVLLALVANMIMLSLQRDGQPGAHRIAIGIELTISAGRIECSLEVG